MRRTWATELTACHYHAHGRTRNGGSCTFPSNCTQLDDTEVFTVYTVFFTHVTEICMFYEGVIAHDRTLRVLENIQTVSSQSLALRETQQDHLDAMSRIVHGIQSLHTEIRGTQETTGHLHRQLSDIHAYVQDQVQLQQFGLADLLWFALSIAAHWNRQREYMIFHVLFSLMLEMCLPRHRTFLRMTTHLLSIFHYNRIVSALDHSRIDALPMPMPKPPILNPFS